MPGPRGPELPSKVGLMEPGLTPLGRPSFLPHLSPRGLCGRTDAVAPSLGLAKRGQEHDICGPGGRGFELGLAF